MELDARNQKSLIDTAILVCAIFASPSPWLPQCHCVPITHREGKNHISQRSWQILNRC